MTECVVCQNIERFSNLFVISLISNNVLNSQLICCKLNYVDQMDPTALKTLLYTLLPRDAL